MKVLGTPPGSSWRSWDSPRKAKMELGTPPGRTKGSRGLPRKAMRKPETGGSSRRRCPYQDDHQCFTSCLIGHAFGTSPCLLPLGLHTGVEMHSTWRDDSPDEWTRSLEHMPQHRWFYQFPGKALEQTSGESHRYRFLHSHTAAVLSSLFTGEIYMKDALSTELYLFLLHACH